MPALPVSQLNAVSLRRLFPSASFVGGTEIVAKDLAQHSNECQPGCLFAALPGSSSNGARFVAEAVANGAATILAESPVADVEVPQCIVPDAREAFARLCHAVNRWPANKLNVIGVTGTNGKTTVTWLLRSILSAAGFRTGLTGTIEFDDGVESHSATMTTADSQVFAGQLAAMVENDCTHAVVELSSHALEQSRVAGVSLAAAAVTNVTQDHFDYHGDFESYCESKSKIAGLCADGVPFLINADDEGCEVLAGMLDTSIDVQRFGIHCSADVRASVLTSGRQGSRFACRFGGQEFEATTSLVGEHNVSNCLAAASIALQLGISEQQIIAGIANVRVVPGRLRRVNLGQPFDVYVDYAHTPDALERVIRSVNAHTSGRTFCVVGAGGDRDKSKRPLLGGAASNANVVVLTNDNPRTEDPETIIHEIQSGLEHGCEVIIQQDRELAIQQAITQARPGDAVLIAGKGHETTQTIGRQTLPFDDLIVARRAIADVMSTTAWGQKRKGA